MILGQLLHAEAVEPCLDHLPTANWCDTHTLVEPGKNIAVGDPFDVSELARTTRHRLQVLGARFSYPGLIEGHDGLGVHLRSPRRLLGSEASTITVTGDCTLTEVWEHLRAAGRTLPVCPPVITTQTVAGAIGTGTHAQGTREGLLADTVLGFEFVDASGRWHRIGRDDPAFGAFQLHLGALGLITSVTLATVPNSSYLCHKYTTSGDDLRAHLGAWNQRSEHVKVWWFTEEDRAHVWEVGPAGGRTPSAPDSSPHTDLNQVLADTQQRMGRDLRSDDRQLASQRTVGRFYDYADATGDLVKIFRNGIPAPQVNMEVGVPFERFEAAADDLRRVLADSAYHLHYPVILRPTGPSEAWLAAAYRRPTCWFGFVVYQRADGTVADGSVELLGEIQRALAAHQGIPHWGKYFDPSYFDFHALPRWDDFAGVRRRFDPQGRFLNPKLAEILEA